jgi:hypothetical protein
MIAGILALALALAPSNGAELATSAAESAPQPQGRMLRFIGEQVSFEPIECRIHDWPYRDNDDDPSDGITYPTGCNEDDLNYRARYRVRLAIDGALPETVEFLATGWTAHYAESRHALLYVLDSLDGTLLPGGLAIPVYPTVDGAWASCDADEGSELLEFNGKLVFGRTDGMSSHGIAERYPESDYVIIGQQALCIRGRRVPALIEELDRELDELRNQEFPHLPPANPKAVRP